LACLPPRHFQTDGAIGADRAAAWCRITVETCLDLERERSGLPAPLRIAVFAIRCASRILARGYPDVAARALRCGSQRFDAVVGDQAAVTRGIFPVGFVWATNLTRSAATCARI